MITRLPERNDGTRYASVLPVPVPASTIRWRFSSSACFDGLRHLPVVRAGTRRQDVMRESRPPGAKKPCRVKVACWEGADKVNLYNSWWENEPSAGSPICLPEKSSEYIQIQAVNLFKV